MKRFYVEIKENIIKNPAGMDGKGIEDVEIIEPLKEVTEDFYNQYKDLLPATFELDKEDNMINITPLPRPEPMIPEPSETEMLRDYVLDTDYRLILLELGL